MAANEQFSQAATLAASSDYIPWLPPAPAEAPLGKGVSKMEPGSANATDSVFTGSLARRPKLHISAQAISSVQITKRSEGGLLEPGLPLRRQPNAP